MVIPLLHLLAAGIILLLAPLVLTAGNWQVRHPRLALTLWFCAFFAGIANGIASILLSLLAGLGGGQVANITEAKMLLVAGWAGVAMLCAVITVVSAFAEPLAESWRANIGQFAPVAIARERHDGVTLVWFEAPEPFACAVPSATPEIFVSTSLQRLLSEAQLRAVLAHERAHLRQRHGIAVRIAEINALCVPRILPAGRALKRATLLLVELIADDAAARRVGTDQLASALRTLGHATGDTGCILRADRLALCPRRSTRSTPAAAPAAAPQNYYMM